ncbi:CoA transferase, partial [Streptomyces sp. DSM 41635]|nr:CoA transferase [Streptomyces sp. DSM 41635]
PNGEISALLPPPVISGVELGMGAVPGLGEHTDAILRGIGLSAEQIDVLREQGAVGPAYQS